MHRIQPEAARARLPTTPPAPPSEPAPPPAPPSAPTSPAPPPQLQAPSARLPGRHSPPASVTPSTELPPLSPPKPTETPKHRPSPKHRDWRGPAPSMLSLSLDASPFNMLAAEEAAAIADDTEARDEAVARDDAREARAEAAADEAVAAEAVASSFFAFDAPRYGRGASLTQPPSPAPLLHPRRPQVRDRAATLGTPTLPESLPESLQLPTQAEASEPSASDATTSKQPRVLAGKRERRQKVVHRRVRSFDDLEQLLD